MVRMAPFYVLEFTFAMILLKKEIAIQSLRKLGLSTEDLVILFVMLIGFLLLL